MNRESYNFTSLNQWRDLEWPLRQKWIFLSRNQVFSLPVVYGLLLVQKKNIFVSFVSIRSFWAVYERIFSILRILNLELTFAVCSERESKSTIFAPFWID